MHDSNIDYDVALARYDILSGLLSAKFSLRFESSRLFLRPGSYTVYWCVNGLTPY